MIEKYSNEVIKILYEIYLKAQEKGDIISTDFSCEQKKIAALEAEIGKHELKQIFEYLCSQNYTEIQGSNITFYINSKYKLLTIQGLDYIDNLNKPFYKKAIEGVINFLRCNAAVITVIITVLTFVVYVINTMVNK